MKKLTLLLATFYVLNVSAQNSANFTFKMLQQLEGEKDKKSVFISPYSIRTILSLCAEGAKGKTASEMFESLSLPIEPEQRRKEMQATTGQLHQAKGFELLTTNTIWINKTLSLLKSFSQVGETYYNSLTKSIGFSENAEKARKTINNFVAEKTKQMIKNLLPEGVITKETQMILTNTIYFKADWEKNFDKKNTQEKDFWLTSTEKKKAKMMYQKNRFSGGIFENHKVIALPYKGGEVRMWIVLPENKDLPALIKKMNPPMWQSLKSAAYNQEVLLTLPLFEFETKYKLKENLRGLGMNMAFSDAAEFGNISANASLKISEVIHQAKIKVEEKGTEAAAATAVVVNVTSSGIRNEMPPPPLVFTADHPFLFVIEHIATQEILFAGTMLDPTKQ